MASRARLNNVATADAYGEGASLDTHGANELNVIVTNAAVYMQVDEGGGGARQWAEEEFLPPGGYSWDIGPGRAHERADAVQFRSATAGVPGRVSVTA